MKTETSSTANTLESLPDPGLCRECGLLYRDGKYQVCEHPPAEARYMLCPACEATRRQDCRGLLTIRGPQLAQQLDEIEALIHASADELLQQQPLERLLAVVRLDDALEVCSLYEFAARRIAEAVHQRWQGELRMHYIDHGHKLMLFLELG